MILAPALLLLAIAAGSSCKRASPSLAQIPYSNDFSSPLGPEWFLSGGQWSVSDGVLFTSGANNAPIFLETDLPDDVVVEFDAFSETEAVDTKCELMTDGLTHQSGYVFILGGWKNSKSIIAKQDEHGREGTAVFSRTPTSVTAGRWYHWRIVKKKGDLEWFLDGTKYLSFHDPEPLEGPRHNRFAFNNWQNRIRFDNLSIRSYEDDAKHPSAQAKPESGQDVPSAKPEGTSAGETKAEAPPRAEGTSPEGKQREGSHNLEELAPDDIPSGGVPAEPPSEAPSAQP